MANRQLVICIDTELFFNDDDDMITSIHVCMALEFILNCMCIFKVACLFSCSNLFWWILHFR